MALCLEGARGLPSHGRTVVDRQRTKASTRPGALAEAAQRRPPRGRETAATCLKWVHFRIVATELLGADDARSGFGTGTSIEVLLLARVRHEGWPRRDIGVFEDHWEKVRMETVAYGEPAPGDAKNGTLTECQKKHRDVELFRGRIQTGGHMQAGSVELGMRRNVR